MNPLTFTYRLLLLTAALATGTSMLVQPYTTAVGGRLGTGTGVTLKHYLAEPFAVEGQLLYQGLGLRAGAMGLYHFDIDRRGNNRFYTGAGAYAGYLGRKKETDRLRAVAGIDLSAGVELVFPTLPASISLDWQPGLQFAGDGPSLRLQQAGMSLRVFLR